MCQLAKFLGTPLAIRIVQTWNIKNDMWKYNLKFDLISQLVRNCLILGLFLFHINCTLYVNFVIWKKMIPSSTLSVVVSSTKQKK